MNQPAASTVIWTSLPSGVSGRPVTPVSWNMIRRDDPSVPVSMYRTIASTESPVTPLKVGSSELKLPSLPIALPDRFAEVAIRAADGMSLRNSCEALYV